MGIFERFLSLWVGAAIVMGVGLGLFSPETFQAVSEMEWGGVNGVVAVLIWLMVFPMMLNVEPRSLRSVTKEPRALGLTVVVNWLIKPFSMAALGIVFFQWIFADLVPPDEAAEYIAGLILLGVAPCTAMVFVWSSLTKGDANFTLVQVTLNDIILVFAFAPLAGFLLGVTDIEVPWETLLVSVLVFVVVPLFLALLVQFVVKRRGVDGVLESLSARLKPTSMAGLLLTVVLLFGFQAETLMAKPGRVVLIAIPLLIQSYGIFALAYWAAKRLKLRHSVAGPAALIGTSNFFELAVAVAISLFGLGSGAALATVVGVLIEVPVMLSLVAFTNRTGHWFPDGEEGSSNP
jgi:ACR3 family arsenite transporter